MYADLILTDWNTSRLSFSNVWQYACYVTSVNVTYSNGYWQISDFFSIQKRVLYGDNIVSA